MFHLNGYSSLQLIASGSLCHVYSAHRETDGMHVAIKALKPENVPDAAKRAAFTNEIAILRELDHPQIPKFLDSIVAETNTILIQEYIDASTIRQLIAERKLQPRDSFRTAVSLCDVLEYLHKKSICHCDIKPGNILSTQQRTFLIDFTVATYFPTQQKHPFGTYRYMAPEVISGKSPSPQSDLFSLTLVVYEMIMLGPLIPEKISLSHLFNFLVSNEHRRRIHSLKLPPLLQSFFVRGSALNPEERFQTAAEMKSALDIARR